MPGLEVTRPCDPRRFHEAPAVRPLLLVASGLQQARVTPDDDRAGRLLLSTGRRRSSDTPGSTHRWRRHRPRAERAGPAGLDEPHPWPAHGAGAVHAVDHELRLGA